MANIEYGFIGRDESGKRKAYTIHHPCCFGSLGTALVELNLRRDRYVPIENVEWIPGKVIISMQETAEDFRKWWKKLRTDFPTYIAGGQKHKAPKAVYYDVNSRQPGHLNKGGKGPLKQAPKSSYVILSFPEGITNDALYVGLKFYMKNLMNPHTVKDSGTEKTMCQLWAKAEEKLKAAGIKKPHMGAIMTVVSSASGNFTLGYSWPVSGGEVHKVALARFLNGVYESSHYVDDGQKYYETKAFAIYNSKSAIKDISGWGPAPEGDVKMPPVMGWDGAVQRVVECLS